MISVTLAIPNTAPASPGGSGWRPPHPSEELVAGLGADQPLAHLGQTLRVRDAGQHRRQPPPGPGEPLRNTSRCNSTVHSWMRSAIIGSVRH